MPAFVATVKLIATDPTDAFGRLRRDGDLTSPILFGVITTLLVLLLVTAEAALLAAVFPSAFSPTDAPTTLDSVDVIGTLVIWPVLFIVNAFVAAAVNHLALLLVGALDRSETGFEGTLKAYAYSLMALFTFVVPLIGPLVGVIWVDRAAGRGLCGSAPHQPRTSARGRAHAHRSLLPVHPRDRFDLLCRARIDSRSDEPMNRQLAFLWGGVALSLVVSSPWAPEISGALWGCAFKSVTGYACPTCGTTRAAMLLARFDVVSALMHYPLATLGWTFLIVGGFVASTLTLVGKRVPPVPTHLPGWARVSIVLSLLLNWAYLLATGA